MQRFWNIVKNGATKKNSTKLNMIVPITFTAPTPFSEMKLVAIPNNPKIIESMIITTTKIAR